MIFWEINNVIWIISICRPFVYQPDKMKKRKREGYRHGTFLQVDGNGPLLTFSYACTSQSVSQSKNKTNQSETSISGSSQVSHAGHYFFLFAGIHRWLWEILFFFSCFYHCSIRVTERKNNSRNEYDTQKLQQPYHHSVLQEFLGLLLINHVWPHQIRFDPVFLRFGEYITTVLTGLILLLLNSFGRLLFDHCFFLTQIPKFWHLTLSCVFFSFTLIPIMVDLNLSKLLCTFDTSVNETTEPV